MLRQAECIFAAKGFHNTTMAEIAEASGFAVGTLYHFFESKETLYTAMISEKLDIMYSETRKAVNSAEGTENKLKELVNSHFYFVESNIDFCNLFIRGDALVIMKGQSALKSRMIEDYYSHVDFIEEIIKSGIATGYLKPVQARMSAIALLGMIRSFIYDWMISRQYFLLSERSDDLINIFLNGLKAEVTE